MKQLKVLYFIAYPQRMAGANRSLYELVRNLPKNVAPIVVIVDDGEVAEHYKLEGFETHVLQTGRFLSEYGRAMLRWSLLKMVWVFACELIPYTFALMRLFLRVSPNLIHVNDARGCVLIGLAAFAVKLPVVAHMRGEMTIGGIAKALFERVPRRIITVCEAIKGSLTCLGRKKAVCIYNGIRDAQIRIPPTWLNRLGQEGIVRVMCFASIVPFKGHSCLLKAAAELNKRGLQEKYCIFCIGELVPEYTEYHDALFALQQTLSLRNVTFCGWQPEPFKFYSAADVVVLASANHGSVVINGKTFDVRGAEGFPRTILEAMAYGLPVIACKNAGVEEQIQNGVTGFSVPQWDYSAFADALEKLILDASRREAMGVSARNKVRSQFSTEAYVANVVNLYYETVQGKRI